MEKDQFQIQVVGIVFDPKERKVLIGKNKGDEKFSFVEEPLTSEEEIDKCLKRSVKEKTGYIVHNLGTIYCENLLQNKTKFKIHFLCEATEGDLKKGEKVEEILWIKPSEVEEKLEVQLPTRLHEYLLNLE